MNRWLSHSACQTLDSGCRWEHKENTISGAGMGVQTIGEAYQAGWRIHVRCAWGRREAKERARLSRKGRAGPAHADLDKRRRLPAHQLEAWLKCPMCGSRKVSVIFDVPSWCRCDRAGHTEPSTHFAVPTPGL